MIPLLLMLWVTPLASAQAPTSTGTAVAGASSELDRAYQREYAFLHAEAAALRQRLAEVERDRSARLGKAERELDGLQGQLLSLTREADQAEDLLRESERSAERSVESSELLRTTLTQAATTLGQDEKAPRDDASSVELATGLVQLFQTAATDLQTSSQLRIVEGPLFDAQGAARPGTIVELGEIARFGRAEGADGAAEGALVPAGEGRLRLADGERVADGGRTAGALIAGTIPDTVTVHLFESMDRRVEAQKEKTFSDTVDAGGMEGTVILALGALAAVLILARLFLLTRAGRSGEAFAERLVERIEAGHPEEAVMIARSNRSAAGRVFASVLSAWSGTSAPTRELLESHASEALLREQPPLERFAAGLRVIAAVAPLLGLLGTVSGMISTFELITEFGTGDPKMLSTGISQALVTTQLGLMVAIPVLLIGNALRTQAESVLSSLETGALSLINSLAPEQSVETLKESASA